jgi:hypothetical protein
MVHTYNPSYSGGRDQEDGGSKPAQTNSLRDLLLKKNPSQKSIGEVAQVVACLPSKHKALGANPSTAKKRKRS